MLVKERMTRQPILASPDLPISEALNLMKKERIRRLPVVDKNGHLVGIVSDKDLLHASPSPATSLSVWEVTYLLGKIKIEDVMTKKVITVTEDTPLEDAARIMADNKIGGLPVVKDVSVVGIITETDLFKVFLELLGAREKGVRVTTLVPEVPGELARITQAIASNGGNIIALTQYQGTDSTNRQVMLKVTGMSKDKLLEVLKPVVISVEDARES
ncbi:MAG TPA: CBS and ACT domain-containing protein [Anaerolineae bacterium]|nr:CBS and ACT domain-containing protein [Anaerolineae bacterium]